MRRDADKLVNWLNTRAMEKQGVDDLIEMLVAKSYKQVAFTKMKNAKKFVSLWKEKNKNVVARVTSSTGPTIENPNEKVKNAYYVTIEKV